MDVGPRQAGRMRAFECRRAHRVEIWKLEALPRGLANVNLAVGEPAEHGDPIVELPSALRDDQARVSGERVGVDRRNED